GIFSSLTVEGQFVQENNIVNGFGFLTQTPNNGTESAVSAGSITIQPAQYSTTTSITVKLYDTAAKSNKLDLADIKVVTDGFDPIIVDVNNDAHLIPSDSTGIVSSYLYSGGIIQVFENTAELQYIGPSATLNRQQWKITAVNGKNITPGNIPTLADSGQKYVTFPDHSNMTSNTASITYTISAKNTNDQIITGIVGGQTFTKSFTTAIFRIINATTIRVDDFGNVIQAVVNAQKIDKEVTTSPFGWITEQLDNGSISARVQLTSTGYTTKAIKTTKKVTIRLYETQTSTLLLDTAEIQVISDGISPSVFNVDVENDSHGIPFARTSTGTYTGVYNYSGTKIQVFENTSELQYVKGTPTIGQWTIASTTSSGIQCSIDSSATNKPSAVSGQKYATVSDHSNMTSDTATITYNITAVTAKGVTITNIFGNQTFNKNLNSGIYRIVGAGSIVRNKAGIFSSLTVEGQFVQENNIVNGFGFLTQTPNNGT
ncbi:MAG: hypothetical protein EBS53_16870, partial [Bacteroidetes bacterium]|nr:hypothetical protein [Bacteroidota bacterium]